MSEKEKLSAIETEKYGVFSLSAILSKFRLYMKRQDRASLSGSLQNEVWPRQLFFAKKKFFDNKFYQFSFTAETRKYSFGVMPNFLLKAR